MAFFLYMCNCTTDSKDLHNVIIIVFEYIQTVPLLSIDDFDTERATQVHKSTSTLIQQHLMQPYPYMLYDVMYTKKVFFS